MISEIKLNGFDRIKQELEEKMTYKAYLENNVSSLENSLRILKTHFKHCGNLNNKLLKENDILYQTGDVRKNY
jgi:hypothetical protein